MRRAEIRLADLEPVIGSEANKRGPVVIVSNDGANAVATRRERGVVTVVPISSNIARVYPFQVLLTAADSGLRVDSKAQAEQIRSISTERIGPLIGRVPALAMKRIDDALRLHLHL